MVQPDRPTPTETPRQQPRIVVIAATLLVFVIAALTVGRLTAPAPEPTVTPTSEPPIATPATTTTTTPFDPDDFRIVDVEQGPSVVWARVHGVPSTFPVALVSHQGRAYLFGADQPSWSTGPTSVLEAWSTDDGIFWTGHGEVIRPDYRTSTVISTETGLIALGESLAGPEPAIWVSDDASSWSRIALPLPRELTAGETIELTTAASSEETLVVFGMVYQLPERAAAEYLPEEIAALLDQYGYGFGDQSLQIQGPFGITIFSATREELGMPLEIWARLNTGGYQQTYVWMSTDRGATWKTAPFEEAQWIETAWVDDDGTVEVIGQGTSGPTRWASSDGEHWGANQITSQLDQTVRWGDGFAAVYWGLHTPDVSISSDGQRWTNIGLGEVLPNEIGWQIWPLMADEELGIAAVVTGYRDGSTFAQPTPYLDKDGYRVTLDYGANQIVISDLEAERLLLTIPIYTETAKDIIETDLATRTVTFLDPDTSEPIVTVTLEELRIAEDVAWSQENNARPLRGFFLSPDGENWSLQDMTEWFGNDDVMHITSLNDRLVAVTLDQFWYRSDAPQSRMWMGILPDR